MEKALRRNPRSFLPLRYRLGVFVQWKRIGADSYKLPGVCPVVGAKSRDLICLAREERRVIVLTGILEWTLRRV